MSHTESCEDQSAFTLVRNLPGVRDPREEPPVDIATCETCIRELFNPTSRRYRYPFTHCASCGPRASISTDYLFEREQTSLSKFERCEQCRCEFDDPVNPHFTDQTISCPDCGPRYRVRLATGATLDCDPIECGANALTEGSVLALKGYGSFQLAVDATNPMAIETLRERRDMPSKPFPVLVPTLAIAKELGVLTPADEAILTGPERAIVVVPRRANGLARLGIPDTIATHTDDIGLVLPHSPSQHLLFWAPGTHPSRDPPRFKALVLCAATLTNQPTIRENEDALYKLRDIADLFFEHDRDIAQPYDDPIFLSTHHGPIPLRLSRSTTPRVLRLPERFLAAPAILAMGSDSRCAPAVFNQGAIHLSAHIGNLIAEESADALVQSATAMCHRLRVFPEFVTHGLNPENLGTRIAQGLGTPTLPIQHHHAHAVSCLVDNEFDGDALALVLDGADWGTNETLWGGELLLVNYTQFTRLRHFEEIELPGGMDTFKEPWRAAACWLHQAFPESDAPPLPWHSRRNHGALAALEKMRARKINTPRVSSCGRLFDAACSLLSETDRITYEGQSLHILDKLVAQSPATGEIPLPEDIKPPGNSVIPITDLLRALVFEQVDGKPPPSSARRFYERLSARLVSTVIEAAKKHRIEHIALTGACFESRLLLEMVASALNRAAITPLIHHRVPPNDGGLAVGQAAIAAARTID